MSFLNVVQSYSDEIHAICYLDIISFFCMVYAFNFIKKKKRNYFIKKIIYNKNNVINNSKKDFDTKQIMKLFYYWS